MRISQVAATGALNEAAELVKELAQLGWEKNGEVAILEEALNRAYDAIDDEAGVEDKETRLARFHDAARQLQKRRRSCRKALRRKVCTLCAIAVPSFHVFAGCGIASGALQSEETSKYLEDARNGVAGAAEELANAVRHLRKTLVKAVSSCIAEPPTLHLPSLAMLSARCWMSSGRSCC